jgi:PIN domain nuclease of toxin-antitoxin system
VILLDTHVVVWLLSGREKISKVATDTIEASGEDSQALAISDFTLLELAQIIARGRVGINTSLDAFLQEVESRFVVLPMTAQICARTATLPPDYPKDPADRVIGATALVEGLPLVTADRNIQRTKAIRTIW